MAWTLPSHASLTFGALISRWLALQPLTRCRVVKRAAVVSRLFYQIAHYLLAETASPDSKDPLDSRFRQVYHARQACGIIAHTTDCGISSLAMRSLAIVGPCLTEPKEQDEVLTLLGTLRQRSGLQLHSVEKGLREAWARQRSSAQQQQQHAGGRMGLSVTPTQMACGRLFEMDSGANPLWGAAFGMPDAPYRNWYVPPNRTAIYSPPLL